MTDLRDRPADKKLAPAAIPEPTLSKPSLLHTEIMSLNVGPQHPSTHGVLRLVVDMDGEYVVKVVPHMGYLHTGFEKTFEARTYQQGVTYAPRTDYLHSFSHELAYVLSVEKLLSA